MQDRVLDPADVLVDGKPVSGLFLREGRLSVARIRVAVEVPARVDKGVHGIGFTPRRAAALRTCGVHKLRHLRERRTALLRDGDVLGQQHRQLVVRHRHDAAALAVEHGDRRAPVALAAYAPVL